VVRLRLGAMYPEVTWSSESFSAQAFRLHVVFDGRSINHDLTGTNSFGFERGYYWTSSEYNNENAWTQYWIDGQQFDREKWLSANEQRRKGGAEDPRPFRVRPIRAFG